MTYYEAILGLVAYGAGIFLFGGELQGFEKSDELLFLFLGQVHKKTLVVVVHHFRQVPRGAVMEVRRAGSQTPEYRPFASSDIGAASRYQRLPRIGSETDLARQGARVASQFEYR